MNVVSDRWWIEFERCIIEFLLIIFYVYIKCNREKRDLFIYLFILLFFFFFNEALGKLKISKNIRALNCDIHVISTYPVYCQKLPFDIYVHTRRAIYIVNCFTSRYEGNFNEK